MRSGDSSPNDPVVAALVPEPGDRRWYVIPAGTDWDAILDWLVERALPEYVPQALRRARSPHALDPALQTGAEAAAHRSLAELDDRYAAERQRLEAQLERAKGAAEPIRHGLLYGTGAELVRAVAAVLDAAGFTVTDLDASLGDTASADLLVSYEAERRLVEVKSAAGNAGEALVARLEQHVQTWPQLRSDEPVGGGVLVVNHQHRREPGERDAAVYTRAVFVGSPAVPVLATRQLFDWWRDADWTAIRDAVLARPGESAAGLAAPATPPPSAPRAPEAPGNPRGARRLLGRRGSRGG